MRSIAPHNRHKQRYLDLKREAVSLERSLAEARSQYGAALVRLNQSTRKIAPLAEDLRRVRAQLDTNGATVACLRLDDKTRWCFEHIAPVGARAEMLRIRNEPVTGLIAGQSYRYVDDFDLDGSIDVGSTTTLEGEPHAPVGKISQFFHRATNRGDQFRGDFQKLYDEGIQVALKYLGE